MAPTLFDDCVRAYDGPRLHAEPEFAYLNRSARPVCHRLRCLLEEWFSRYPATKQSRLRSDFQDVNSPKKTFSAFYELLSHEVLLSLGCRVLVDPKPAGPNTRGPDFLVKAVGSEPFYLEAVVATDISRDDEKAAARLNDFYDSINSIDSPDFWLNIDAHNLRPRATVPGHIRQDLAQWLASLDVNTVYRRALAYDFLHLPQRTYELDGQTITFEACPKEPEHRGNPSFRNIGFYPTKGGVIEADRAIRESVSKKARRYGQLDLPFVIAVNALSAFADSRDVERALYGNARYSTDTPLVLRALSRDSRSVWTGPTGAKFTRVSAVLVTHLRQMFDVVRGDMRLYLNPWAQRPYESALVRLPTGSLAEEGVVHQPGLTLATILGLPPEWPEDMSTGSELPPWPGA